MPQVKSQSRHLLAVRQFLQSFCNSPASFVVGPTTDREMPMKDEGGESIIRREPSAAVQARLKCKEKGKERLGRKASFFAFCQNVKCVPGQGGVPRHHLPVRVILDWAGRL